MKRLLTALILLIIVGSIYAPLCAEAKPQADTHKVEGKVATWSKLGGVSSLKVRPGNLAEYLKVEERPGEVEYTWTLSSKPNTNRFTLTLEYSNVVYYTQPALDAKTYPKGWRANSTHVFDEKGVLREYRPIDVVGSIAVYSTYRDGIYGTGKIAHIYRPLVWDASGKQTWGTLSVEGNTLIVTVDQRWLDKAKYPVTVDPTFGSTSIGASTETISAGQAYGTLVTTPSANSIYVSKFTAYTDNNGGSGVNYYRASIWVNSNGGAVVGSGNAASGSVSGAYAWTDNAVTTFQITASTDYIIGIQIDSNTARIKYDTGTGGTGHRDGSNLYASPGVFDWTANTDYVYSLYATYYSAPTITSSVISDMDDTDNIYTMKKYYTFTTVIADSDGGSDINEISIRGMQGATIRWLVNATALSTSPAYAIVTGDTTIDIDSGSCTWSAGASSGTLVLKIRFEWDATAEADCELAVWANDTAGHTVGWTTVHSDYFDVISRLTTTSLTGNVTGTTANQPVMISGFVRYATTPTGDNSSTSYPPDAQFTRVKIYDAESNYFGEDNAVVNGYFAVNGTSGAMLGVTLYYVWLDMAGDYVDGLAPDGDYATINVESSFFLSQLIEQAAAFFGAVFPGFASFLDGLSDMVGGFSTYFGGTVTSIVDGVTMVFKIMVGFATFALDWGTRIADWVVDITTEVLNILNGTSAAATGLGNIWTLFNVTSWIDFIPLMLILFWLESLDVREKKQGGGWVQIAIADIQIATYLLGLILEYSWMVFNFVFNTIINLASLIPGL